MASGTKVSVQVSTRANFKYGFTTQADTTDQNVLGHTPITGALAAGVMFGVNSPKPAVMKKIKSDGRSVSSFVDAGSRTSAATAGWTTVKRAKARRSTGGRFTKLVYVKFPVGPTASAVQVQYAWRMPTTLYTALAADRAALGIKDVTATEDAFDLVFGSTQKPPKGYKYTATGILSTFVDPDATLPAGWALAGGELE